MLKKVKWVLVALAVLFIALQFVRPARTNPLVDESKTVQANTQMTPQVNAILERSCRDCHSNKTVWPWYTNVSPVSWFVANHVEEGRRDMNFSEWAKYDRRRRDAYLDLICDMVSKGMMPLSSYTRIHQQAKISTDDARAICEWTEAERQRLRQTSL
ncbi:MAG: heme-binding domain-containing protein [Pyrinomonadaceae bacterium]